MAYKICIICNGCVKCLDAEELNKLPSIKDRGQTQTDRVTVLTDPNPNLRSWLSMIQSPANCGHDLYRLQSYKFTTRSLQIELDGVWDWTPLVVNLSWICCITCRANSQVCNKYTTSCTTNRKPTTNRPQNSLSPNADYKSWLHSAISGSFTSWAELNYTSRPSYTYTKRRWSGSCVKITTHLGLIGYRHRNKLGRLVMNTSFSEGTVHARVHSSRNSVEFNSVNSHNENEAF